MQEASRLFSFAGGESGTWQVARMETLCGEILPAVAAVSVIGGGTAVPAVWQLRGVLSNQRYTTAEEAGRLAAEYAALDRPESRCAVLIPIRKTPAWWALSQDARRRIFEDRSAHIQIGQRYAAKIARRLHHCRDLGEPQPFDFLTWFEFAPAEEPLFEDLVAALRATEEWQYVDREIDIRLFKP